MNTIEECSQGPYAPEVQLAMAKLWAAIWLIPSLGSIPILFLQSSKPKPLPENSTLGDFIESIPIERWVAATVITIELLLILRVVMASWKVQNSNNP